MKSLRAAEVLAWIFLLQISFAQTSRLNWDAADSLIVRLQPLVFHTLPPAVVRYLEASGYTIPQCWCDTAPHNVITGEFFEKGKTDWAVLASKKRISTILVFRNASDTSPARLGEMEDRSSLQSLGSGSIGFSRVIRIAVKASPEKFSVKRSAPAPTSFNHDAIEDRFVEKGSVGYYFNGGKWTTLAGAD